MGICWSTNLPEEEDSIQNSKSLKKKARKIVEFGRDEVNLDELLASLRTGLVFAPTEFPVLPGGLNTTAKVTFTIGNSELQRRQEAKEESLHKRQISNESNENRDEMQLQGDQYKPDTEPYMLKVTLEGHGWAKGLVMNLIVQPVVGPFARRNLQFNWRDDILKVVGCIRGEIEAHSLPLSFESEMEFCKCCLQLTYQSKNKNIHEQGDEDSDQILRNASETSIPSLKYSAYKVAVANLDGVSTRPDTIPAKLRHIFFGTQDPIDVSIALWPLTYNADATLSMKVKSGILFGELVYLVKEHLCIKSDHTLKLYNNHRPVYISETVSDDCKHLDCFVIVRDSENTMGSYSSLDEDPGSYNTNVELVVSLVGKEIQGIETDLEMPMKEFDALVRDKFKLKQDSFLVILAEDDFAPQYTADDNWKCTYPFSIPDNSFGAGLRRSFRRLSTRRRGGGERPHTPTSGTNTNVNVFAPLMAEVIELLSSNERRFPQTADKCGLSIEELYKSMPMYQMSLEQCGIHPYSMIQVFEVTGPSIPITVRVISDYTNKDATTQHGTQALRTRLANIMDINPDWPINTFLQYIDAFVSLSSFSKQKRLWLKDNSVSDKDDLSTLTLGTLLDSWKPLWWAAKGCSRKQLTTKDIDPSDYLVVEKF